MIEADMSGLCHPATTGALPANQIKVARDFVANYFASIDRSDLAHMVGEGQADDFAEIQVAIGLLSAHVEKIMRYENALSQYADPEFWDQALPGGSLALHDNGEMARNVLDGRPAFYHRD